MKHYALIILRFLLKKLAQATVWRYRPAIIAVTGSAGKTSAKLAIAAVIGGERRVRVSHANFNNELGVPLTILGDHKNIQGILFWPKVIWNGFWHLIVPVEYPEVLVLEYGIDRPGDMRHLIAIAQPNVGVITEIGNIPPHVEFFESPEALAREKARIIECLPVASFAVLNHDSDMVMGLRERTRARVVTYGFKQGAEVLLSDFENLITEGKPQGVRFRIAYGGEAELVELPDALGRTYAYAAGAATAVGLAFGMRLSRVTAGLRNFHPASGRMELVAGQKETLILNDAYNASPISMRAALDTLSSLPGKRKIAVLGDMLEIGNYSIQAHDALGAQAAKAANIIVAIGPHAEFILEGARKAGMRKNYMYSFSVWNEALLPLQEIMRPGDMILVKASHGIHLERLVEGIRAF